MLLYGVLTLSTSARCGLARRHRNICFNRDPKSADEPFLDCVIHIPRICLTDAKALCTEYLLGSFDIRLRMPRWNNGAVMADATLSASYTDMEHRQFFGVTIVMMINVSDLLKREADLALKIRVPKDSVIPQLFF